MVPAQHRYAAIIKCASNHVDHRLQRKFMSLAQIEYPFLLLGRRRLIVQLMDNAGQGSTFDRAQFLLSKQVVYFERYGQLFMADTPLLSDPTFYKALLAETR